LSKLVYGAAVEVRLKAKITMRILSSRRKKISNKVSLTKEGELILSPIKKHHQKILDQRSSKLTKAIHPK
jgi:predicted transcriptional regulator